MCMRANNCLADHCPANNSGQQLCGQQLRGQPAIARPTIPANNCVGGHCPANNCVGGHCSANNCTATKASPGNGPFLRKRNMPKYGHEDRGPPPLKRPPPHGSGGPHGRARWLGQGGHRPAARRHAPARPAGNARADRP